MIAPEIQTEVTLHLGEYQVLIAFNSDDDGIMFHDWWHDEGLPLFQRFVDAGEERK